jgi:hypothetical protein
MLKPKYVLGPGFHGNRNIVRSSILKSVFSDLRKFQIIFVHVEVARMNARANLYTTQIRKYVV